MRWKDKNDETFLSKTQQEVDTTSQSKETFIIDEKIHSDNITLKKNEYIFKKNKSTPRKSKSNADFTIQRILSTTVNQAIYVMKFRNFNGNENRLLRHFMFSVRSYMSKRL